MLLAAVVGVWLLGCKGCSAGMTSSGSLASGVEGVFDTDDNKILILLEVHSEALREKNGICCPPPLSM